MEKFRKILKHPGFWAGIGVIIIVLVIIFSSSGGGSKYDYTKAEKGKLTQEVSVTGDVQAIEGVDLAFERSGKVKRVAVGVGDRVDRGTPLVFLEADDLIAQLEEAKANLEAKKAKLAELKRGPTSSEEKVKKAKVREVEQKLENDYGDVVAAVQNAYSQADDAVHTKASGLFRESVDSYVLEYNACDSSAENIANFSRTKVESMLNKWREELGSLNKNSSRSDFDSALDRSQENLLEVNRFLNYVGDTLATGCELSDAKVSTYRGRIGTARGNVNSALSSIDSLEQSIAANRSALNRAKRELEKLLAGASEEEIKAQEALVKKSSAGISNVKAKIRKTILRAPFSGEVTKIDAEAGEIVNAYKTIASVTSESGFKIDVNIPEIDVAKVETGDRAKVTLDPYGSTEVFKAKVTTIDSTETMVEGVSTYGATLEFTEPDKRIKPGMTANVDIITGVRKDVVYIPQRAVIGEDGKEFVRVLADGKVEKREVTTGMEDSMGNVEIKEGVKEGEKVVVFINNED